MKKKWILSLVAKDPAVVVPILAKEMLLGGVLGHTFLY